MRGNGTRGSLSVAKKRPIRPPDFVGAKGEAWAGQLQNAGLHGIVAIWLVHLPKIHPKLKHWAITVLHLRPIEGMPDAFKRYPEAEYEFSVYSLHPEEAKSPDPDRAPWPYLTPADIQGQFHGIEQGQVHALCDFVARRMINGHLIPDPKTAQKWGNEIKTMVDMLQQTGKGKGQ